VLAFGVGTITFDVLNPWSSIQSSATLVDNGSFLVLTTTRTPLGRAIEFVYILIMPNSRFASLEGYGHAPHLVAPDRYTDEVLSFISDVD